MALPKGKQLTVAVEVVAAVGSLEEVEGSLSESRL